MIVPKANHAVKVVLSVLMSVGLIFGFMPTASAEPGSEPLVQGLPRIAANDAPEAKKLVTFGDSFTANSGSFRPNDQKPALGSQIVNRCDQDFLNWSHHAAWTAETSLGDWSCNGTGGYPVVQLKYYVESAIEYGDIGPGTEKVVIMYGGMDALTWTSVGEDLFSVSIPGGFGQAYYDMIRDITERIRFVAPDADVVLSGYPEMNDGDRVCVGNVFGNGIGVTVLGASQVMPALVEVQRRAAEQNGLQYVDMPSLTAGHGPCSGPDEERWVAGYVDTAPHQMPAHPTDAGHYAMGQIIAHEVFGKGELVS